MRSWICLSKKKVSRAASISPEQLSCSMLNVQEKTFWLFVLIKLENHGNTLPHLKRHIEGILMVT
jgi:hypothetical protein